jgi:nucleoside-diphosphate-sugar epimerase
VYRALAGAAERVGVPLPPEAALGSRSQDYFDTSLIGEELDWAPRFSLDAAIRDYAAWLGTHPY